MCTLRRTRGRPGRLPATEETTGREPGLATGPSAAAGSQRTQPARWTPAGAEPLPWPRPHRGPAPAPCLSSQVVYPELKD